MLITEKSGNINTTSVNGLEIDVVVVEWHETNKRILHKQTISGVPVTLKFLKENPDLKDGDILYRNENKIIAVEINSCDCIVITPRNIPEASAICYEIGNRHLPLFYENDELLIPYETPIHNLLQVSGYDIKVEKRKLNNAFRTTVLPHLQVAGADSLFSRILQNTTSI